MSPGAGRAARRPPALIGRALALGLSATILGACAGATPGLSLDTTAPSGAAERISATVVRPEGAGPFPAVVVMHDCGGLGSRSSGAPDRRARELVARLRDAHGRQLHHPRISRRRLHHRRDAGGRRQPRAARATPTRRWPTCAALGGRTSRRDHGRLARRHDDAGHDATPEGDFAPLAAERRRGFAAAVALYPRCLTRQGTLRGGEGGVYRPVAPLLILIGSVDDWTPADPVASRPSGPGGRDSP